MSTPDRRVRRLAEELRQIRTVIAAQNTPQLGTSSIEDGAIDVHDGDGALVGRVGTQHDGTHGSVTLGGPTPPTPAGTTVTGGQLSATVTWTGEFADGAVAPMDFARLEVHASTDAGTIPDPLPASTTRVATIETAAGASVTFRLPAGTWFVRTITRATSGQFSDPTTALEVTVAPAVDKAVVDQMTRDLDAAESRLADAEQRIGTARTDLNQAWADLYDTGGRVDVITGTLTGRIDDVHNEAAQAQATADRKTETYYTTTAPTTAAGGAPLTVGDLWVNTDDQNHVHRWDGTTWTSLRDATIADAAQAAADALTRARAAETAAQAAQATADDAIRTYYTATPPWADGTTQPDDVLGDMWFELATGIARRWSGTAWQVIQDETVGQALAAAQHAQTTADGKITSFYQPGKPTEAHVGDLWFDTDDGIHPYWCQAEGPPAVWSSVRDRSIADVLAATQDAQQAADAAQTTASGRNRVFWGTADPGAAAGSASGDVWFTYQMVEGRTRIVRQWRWSGTVWEQAALDEAFLPQVAIGTGTYGELDGIRLKAKSVIANTILSPGTVGNILLEDGVITTPKIRAGAVTANEVNAESVAAAVGQFVQADVGKLFVTEGATINAAVIDQLFAQTFAAHKVTTNELAVGAVTAEKLDANAITVNTLKGGFLDAWFGIGTSGFIIAGDWSRSFARIDRDGFSTTQVAEDGAQYTVTRLGSASGNQFSINDASGSSVASIDEEGNTSVSSLSSTNDITIGGSPLLGRLIDPASEVGLWELLPWGAVAFVNLRGSINIGKTIPVGTTSINLGSGRFPTSLGRRYSMTMPFMLKPSSISTNAYITISVFRDGEKVYEENRAVFPGMPKVSGAITTTFPGSAPETTQLSIWVGSTNCAALISTEGTDTWQMHIDDIGPSLSSEINQPQEYVPAGQPAPPPAPSEKQTYTTVWRASDSQAYDGAGTKSEYTRTKNYLAHGSVGDSAGNWRSCIVFNNNATAGHEKGKPMSSALVGAQIVKAELFLGCTHTFDGSGCRVVIRQQTGNVIPGSLAGSPTSTSAEKKYLKGQSLWMPIPASWFSTTNRAVRLGNPASSTSRGYYGLFATHVATNTNIRPALRLTYRK